MSTAGGGRKSISAPRDLPSGAPHQARAPCPHPLTAGGCLGPALRLLHSWAELVRFHHEQELLEASNHPMWFHLLAGTEGSCVFTDSRGDPAQSTRGTPPGSAAAILGKLQTGAAAGCWAPRQSGEGVEPLRLRWVRLRLPPPPSAQGRRRIPAASAGTCGHHPSRSSRPLVHSCARTEMLIFGTLPGACLFGCFRSWTVPQGGAWAQCPRGGPILCKCSSCAGQSLRTAAGGGGRAGDRAPVCRCLETGHSQARRRAPGGPASTAHGPCPPAGGSPLCPATQGPGAARGRH